MMTIDVWLTWLDDNYVSLKSSINDGANFLIHNYNLMSYKGADFREVLRDYIKDAKLDNYEVIMLHYSIIKENEYIKF